MASKKCKYSGTKISLRIFHFEKPAVILLSPKNSNSDNSGAKSIWQADLLNLHLERQWTIKYKIPSAEI